MGLNRRIKFVCIAMCSLMMSVRSCDLHQGWSSFYISGQAFSMEKYAHCVQSMPKLGHAPPENFENVRFLRLNVRAFSPSKQAYMLL